ncbi:hypothetical protein KCP73_05275 [Salmonella enterica subsp. enterica]|nr:hypothetical protein KCP73_05275 [Salmonella enterica subsp. enterica]
MLAGSWDGRNAPPTGRQRSVGLFAAVEIGRSGDGHFKLAFINTFDALFSGMARIWHR